MLVFLHYFLPILAVLGRFLTVELVQAIFTTLGLVLFAIDQVPKILYLIFSLVLCMLATDPKLLLT